MILKFNNFILEKFGTINNVENKLIDKETLLKIHDDIIDKYGGIYGIRDQKQLDSVLVKPYMSAFGQELYPTIYDKAAALLQGIIRNHPLADANKRTAFYVAEYVLNENGCELKVGYMEARPMLVKIASHEMEVEEISEWLKSNC